MRSNVFKCVQMCSDVFRCVQMCLNIYNMFMCLCLLDWSYYLTQKFRGRRRRPGVHFDPPPVFHRSILSTTLTGLSNHRHCPRWNHPSKPPLVVHKAFVRRGNSTNKPMPFLWGDPSFCRRRWRSLLQLEPNCEVLPTNEHESLVDRQSHPPK